MSLDQSLAARLATLEAELAALKKPKPARRLWLGVSLASALLVTASALAVDELHCTEGSGLVCFQPDQPARASDVNANFSTLFGLVSQKADASLLAQKLDVAGLQSSGAWEAYQFDANGGKTVNLLGTSRSICFLSSFSISEIDAPSEWGTCTVEPVNGTWQLRSELSGTNNANLACRARCFSW